MKTNSNGRQPQKSKVEYHNNHSIDCEWVLSGKPEEKSSVALLSPACTLYLLLPLLMIITIYLQHTKERKKWTRKKEEKKRQWPLRSACNTEGQLALTNKIVWGPFRRPLFRAPFSNMYCIVIRSAFYAQGELTPTMRLFVALVRAPFLNIITICIVLSYE